MKVRKLLVGAAGLAAAASLIGLGAGASFTDTASATQHVQTGNINLQISTDGVDYGKTATFAVNDNVSGYGTGVITEKVYLRNTGSLKVESTIAVTKSGNLPVVIDPIMVSWGSPLGTSTITLAPGQSDYVTFAYQVNDLSNANKGQSALITFTANGLG